MRILSLLLLFLTILSFCYSLGAAYCTWTFFKRNRPTKRSPGVPFPPVSVIKPVAELEDCALENFMSFCDQDYPEFEVIFSLSRKEEKAILLLEGLRRRFPTRQIRWVTVNQNEGPNYKVGKLIGAVPKAKYEIMVISDSDMRVSRNYLQEVLKEFLQERAGLVTCLYRGTHIKNIFSGLQSLSIQTDFIPNVLFDRKLEGISYGFGATLCTSKEILKSFGGFEALREYLADDYQMGNRIHQKGGMILLSPYLVDHVSCTKSFGGHLLHHLRWAVTQRICRPIGYAASIVTHSVSLSVIFLILEGFSWTASELFLFLCGFRLLSFAYFNRTVFRNAEVTRYVWLIPFNDLLNTLLWFLSLFIRTVHWRGRLFRVLRGGRIVEV